MSSNGQELVKCYRCERTFPRDEMYETLDLHMHDVYLCEQCEEAEGGDYDPAEARD